VHNYCSYFVWYPSTVISKRFAIFLSFGVTLSTLVSVHVLLLSFSLSFSLLAHLSLSACHYAVYKHPAPNYAPPKQTRPDRALDSAPYHVLVFTRHLSSRPLRPGSDYILQPGHLPFSYHPDIAPAFQRIRRMPFGVKSTPNTWNG
jgi:hypothetical protein